MDRGEQGRQGQAAAGQEGQAAAGQEGRAGGNTGKMEFFFERIGFVPSV
jgi:hypothetical protein